MNVSPNQSPRKPMLLLASSALLLPLAISVTTAQTVSDKAVSGVRLGASTTSSKARVPVAAIAALAHARRLMTPSMAQADESDISAIEISLQKAIELAPEWSEARRVFARWQTTRHRWDVAALGWQAVLKLVPHDREALNEIQNATRHASANLVPSFAVAEQALVRYGHDLSGGFNDDLWVVSQWKYRSLIETRVSAKVESLGVQSLPPLPPLSLKAVDLPPAPKTDEKSAITATPAETPIVPVVPGVTTIVVPEEDGIPITSTAADINGVSIELPDAPKNVSTEARVALARGRKLAELVETLPEAEKWTLIELQRAVELAPQWAEAQRELALWQEAKGEWINAIQSWEKVVKLAPNDVQARMALQNALSMTEAQTLWNNRSLVTLGHDSTNPVGHGEFLSVRALAAPLPARDAEIKAVSSLSPRLSLEEAVKVEVASVPIAVETVGEDKVLLAQATPEPTAPTVSETLPSAPASDTLIPVAPAPIPPEETTVDIGIPATTGTGEDDQPPTILIPVPTAPVAPSVSGSSVNVQTVLPGAASLPKPVAKPIAKPAVKKPVRKPVKATRKATTKIITSSQRRAAAWPFVNQAGKAMAAKNFPVALASYQKAYALDPKNPYSLFGIPNALMILKRYPEAIVGFKRFLASYPNHPKALRGLADSYTFSGQFDESANLNAQIVARNPKDFVAALQAAQVLAWSKKYEESGRFYRMALAAQPNNGAVWTEYAETLSYAKDERARDAFARALELNPQSQRGILGLANLLSWSGDYTSAVPYYGEVLKADPNNLKARIALADALTYSRRAPLAIEEYQTALKLAPDSPEARLGLGRALTLAKRNEEAIALLAPLVQEQPTNTEALEMLAVAQIAEQPGASVATFENLLKLQDQPATRAATLANIADLRVKLNQPDEASVAYDEAIKLAPLDNKIALSYTRALMRSELYAEAEPLLAGVLQRDPSNQAGLLLQAIMAARMGQNERAAALTEQLQTMPLDVSDDALNLFYALRGSGNVVSANRLLAQLAESGTVTPENLIKVANAVRDTGQEEASYALYQRVLQVEPENTEAHLELAEAYMRRKEFDAAQKEVDYVLARQPGSMQAKVMGATLALRREHSDSTYENATIVAKEALEKNPNNIPARMLVGEVSSTRSNFAQAVENYRAVLEVQPANLQARLGLARNLYYLKQVDESIQEYQLLIQQAPDDAIIKLELAQVFLDRNRLDEAQRLFVTVLKSANYPLPENVAQLARVVPGSGDILSANTQQALREFAVQEKNRQSNKTGG